MLEALVSRAARGGVFLDFDGTLSEIAPLPEAAVALPGAAEVLGRLAKRFDLVAIVTGRRVSEVERRLGRPAGVRFFGLYGVEEGASSEGDLPSPAGVRIVEEVLSRVLEVSAGVPGSLVEPKGLNVAVHYRLAPDPEAARLQLLESLQPLAERSGLRLIEGKRVVELVPAASPTKGDLVRREGAGLDAVLYAGDDLADMEAFAAVDRLAEAGAVAVKVAVRSAETPSALMEAADMTVERPAGLLRMLESLLA
jgi:trehalose 6-phosphate phosphatase